MNRSKNPQQGVIALIALVVLAIALVAAGFYWRVTQQQKSLAKNPPKFITHDFIDLSKIYSISKFRSAEGHDFSGGGETCRSMKHYFNQQYDESVSKYMSMHGGVSPSPDGKTDVAIYAPVDGVVSRVESERMPIGQQIYIIPGKAKQFTIRLFHIYQNANIKPGTHISTGQQIGVISKGQNTDISVEVGGNYVSYFDLLPDNLFSAYQARGVANRESLILSKKYRDAHAVPCNQGKESNQQFNYPADYDHKNDVVTLSGYIDPASLGKYQTYPNKK